MRKLRLDVDALKVEEFATTGGSAEERGTVRGHRRSYPNWDCPYSWNGLGCESVSGEVACLCEPQTRVGENTCQCYSVPTDCELC